ncbi:ABC transporter permease [Paraburkholderia fungorum]|uniref:ABC transporter permease n=1 Tax=Paraburkholderia fungorum TaxID=134537 RepID=UPI00402BEA49
MHVNYRCCASRSGTPMRLICWSRSIMANASTTRRGVLAHLFKIEFVTYFKHPLAVFWTFAYPVCMFFLLGSIFGSSGNAPGSSLSYTDYLISGLAALTVISTALFGFAVALVDLRARSRLKLFQVMPFAKHTFFMSFTASRVLILALFCMLFVGGFSRFAPHARPVAAGDLLLFSVFMVAGGLLLIGCSILITAAVKRIATAQALINFINIPLIFLSDIFLPAAILPQWLQSIVHWSPIYLFIEKSRTIYAGAYVLPDVLLWIVVVAAAGIAVIGIASRLFSWNPDEKGV